MWKLDYKASWAPKNWCFWTVVLEKTLESPLDCKESKPVNPKGNQSWIFIGRTNVEGEAPILWPADVKNWLIGEDPDGRKDWRQEEKGMTEDGMVGWHHWLYGHELEQAPGFGDGQGSLACCSPWGHKESDMTGRLNSNKKKTLEPVLDMKVKVHRNFLMVQWLRLQAPNVGGPDSIPSQGTRSHMLQPRVHMPQLKIPHAANKTWYVQINQYFF